MAEFKQTTTNTGSVINSVNENIFFNRTGVALSTMVLVKVNGLAVGAIQKIDITEARTIKMFSEVGTDGAIDSAPTSSTTHSGTCERLRYDGMRVFEAFGCGFLHLKSMRIPINIEIIDKYTSVNDSDESNSIVTTLENVWFKDVKYGYTQDNWQVSDNVSFEFETIHSHLGKSGTGTATTGGSLKIALRKDIYEQTADSTSKRGAMDIPGLIISGFVAAAG